MKVYTDLTPGDLVVLNNLVVVTDLCGIACGIAAGLILSAPTFPLWARLLCAFALCAAGYNIINIWA